MATVTATAIERSGPAIRAALAEYAPGACERFETELRAALTRAADDLDLAGVDAVLTRHAAYLGWRRRWPIAATVNSPAVCSPAVWRPARKPLWAVGEPATAP